MSLCDRCFYRSRTRYGLICGFDGTYNPRKNECRNYKSPAEAEAEKAGNAEAAKLILSYSTSLQNFSLKLKSSAMES